MDRLLAVLFAVWALLAFLPVGAWTGVSTAAYYAEAWGLWVRTLGVIGLVTILVLVLGGERVGRGLRRTLAAVFALPLALYLAGLGVIALLEATAVAYWYFGRMPPVIDAWVQYFQARVLLTGEWVAPPAASPAHFGILFAPITAHGWFGQHPPIHPALLALGLAAGVPWLVTPLLAAALPAAVYALGAGSGDRRVARLAAALVVVSPFVIAIDASAMNHVGAALTVAFGLASLGAVAAGSARAGVVLGAAVGLTLGLRPLDAAVLAVVGAPAVLGGIRTRGGLAMAAGATLAGLAMLAPTLAYNHATSGSIMTFTYSAVWGELMGLDHDVPWGTSLTLQRALGLTAVDAHQMDVYLLEWPLPVTALVALGCWLGCGRRAPGAYGAPAYLLGLVGALFFYFHRDTLFGPRLLFSAAPSMLVMLAAGVVALTDLRRPLRGTRLALGDVPRRARDHGGAGGLYPGAPPSRVASDDRVAGRVAPRGGCGAGGGRAGPGLHLGRSRLAPDRSYVGGWCPDDGLDAALPERRRLPADRRARRHRSRGGARSRVSRAPRAGARRRLDGTAGTRYHTRCPAPLSRRRESVAALCGRDQSRPPGNAAIRTLPLSERSGARGSDRLGA
jgi:hypothetical protein